MSKPFSSLVKSLLWGGSLGLAVLILFYGFLALHQELGVNPNLSFPLAMLTFALVTALALLYFRFRTGR